MPDLVPLPARDIRVDQTDSQLLLRFTTIAANRGTEPLDVIGVPSTTDPTAGVAEQCVAWAAPRVCTARREAGEIAYDPDHGHWHFDAFARYELRRLDSTGAPDESSDGLLAVAFKVTFCLEDNYIDDPGGGLPFYGVVPCQGLMQGISPGWGDEYLADFAGQILDITNVPPGEYALVMIVDPLGRFAESDTTNNQTSVLIELTGQQGPITPL